MARTSNVSHEKRIATVIAVLRGELTATEAGRRVGVAEQTVHNWKARFLAAGAAGMEPGKAASRSQREAQLEAENEELKAALGETVAELRVVKKGRSTREILFPLK